MMSLLRNATKTVLIKAINVTPPAVKTRSIKRWVSPTLRELRVRQKKLGRQAPEPRSRFVEWNYRAELFAFNKRLHEDFQLPLLQVAFTQRSYVLQEEKRQHDLGVEDTDINIQDNVELAKRGEHLAKEYVRSFIKYSLPNVPEAGHRVFTDYLLSRKILAYTALNLGMKDLIFAAEYPPTEETLAQTMLGVIGALAESSGVERTFNFVRDFICTQMNQLDLTQIWEIQDPQSLLKEVCKERKMLEPEPRLIGDCGKNTVLAAYHVGIYSNKQMIGKGFGEDIQTAIKTASLDALQTLFGIQDNMRPLNYSLKVEPKNVKITQ